MIEKADQYIKLQGLQGAYRDARQVSVRNKSRERYVNAQNQIIEKKKTEEPKVDLP